MVSICSLKPALDGKTRFFNASVSSALQGDSSGNSNLLATGEMTDKDSALVPYYSPIDVNTLSSQKRLKSPEISLITLDHHFNYDFEAT